MTNKERWRAGDDELARRRDLADRIGTELGREERETTMAHRGTNDRVQVTSYVPTIVRSLLRHSYARVRWLYLVRDEQRNRRVEHVTEVPDSEGVRIGGISATVPVGAWKIKGVPRATDRPSGVITTPDRAAETSASFGRDGDRSVEEEHVRTDGGQRFPSTEEVADEIGASADRLRSFLKTHPHASASYILTSFGADLQYTDLVEDWLEGVKREQLRRTRGECR